MTFQSNVPKVAPVIWKLQGWHILAFAGFFLVSAAWIFPQKLLINMLTETAHPNLLSVTYLRNLAALHPKDAKLHVSLAEQEMILGNLNNANQAINPFLTLKPTNALQWHIAFLYYQIVYGQTYAAAENSADRLRGEAELKKLLILLAQSPDLPIEQAQQLAQQALALNQANLAVNFYKRIIAVDPHQSPEFLATAAKVALSASDYASSGEFYLLAMQNSTNLEQKRTYYAAAVDSVAEAGKPAATMDFAEKNLDGLADDSKTLIFLAEVALKADQQQYAEKYIKQALNFKYIPGKL